MLPLKVRIVVAILLLLHGAASAQDNLCLAPPSGLVHWWPADGNPKDVVGGYDGVQDGGVAFVPGLSGQAFQFDGLTGYMRIRQPLSETQGTVAFWLNRGEVTDGSDVYFGSGYGASRTPAFYVRASGTLLWEFNDLAPRDSGVLLPPGQWHHLAMTWAATEGGRRVNVYVNGSLVDFGVAIGGLAWAEPFVGAFNLNGAPDQFSNALIDELSTYYRPLTQDELRAIVEAGSAGRCADRDGDGYEWPADCNDADPLTYPTAPDTCDGRDNDCNGQTDETLDCSLSCVSISGVLAWWAGDGDSRDLLGPNPGSVIGTTTYGPGISRHAFSFNGSTDGVIISSSSTLTPSHSFSIDAWIYPVTNNGYGIILRKWRDDNARAYGFATVSGRGLEFAISDDSHQGDTSFHQFTVLGVLSMNAWNHVAAVYDQPTGTRFIYVDGVEVARRVDLPITITNASADVGIGSGPSNYHFGGLIDEVTLYDIALSSSEIIAIYQAGSRGKCLAGDSDGDRFAPPDDCDDDTPTVFPGAPQVCDGANNDCLALGWPTLPSNELDHDTDGVRVCAGDCDDANSLVFPDAPQICDGYNNDCDASGWPTLTGTDEADGDSDGFSTCQGDCDDTSASILPGGFQICGDGLNNDCLSPLWPRLMGTNDFDDDGDGFSECHNDCDDTNPKRHPGAPELCNDIDEDCNGLVDDDTAGLDSDGDTVHNACDNCRVAYNPTQQDTDRDHLGNACDNCFAVTNADQSDLDRDQHGDVCDNCPAQYNPFQDDYDSDTVGDVCDNCFLHPNPDQGDIDTDIEGDVCDLDDNYILVRAPDSFTVEWQKEIDFDSFNVYRGDLLALRALGLYTQDPRIVLLASQVCEITDTFVFDNPDLATGEAVFYLVTGNNQGAEGSLGASSAGIERPNAFPCP